MCAGYSRSATPSPSNHVLELAFYTGAHVCWNIKEPSPNCYPKVGSTLSKMSSNYIALAVPFTKNTWTQKFGGMSTYFCSYSVDSVSLCGFPRISTSKLAEGSESKVRTLPISAIVPLVTVMIYAYQLNDPSYICSDRSVDITLGINYLTTAGHKNPQKNKIQS